MQRSHYKSDAAVPRYVGDALGSRVITHPHPAREKHHVVAHHRDLAAAPYAIQFVPGREPDGLPSFPRPRELLP